MSQDAALVVLALPGPQYWFDFAGGEYRICGIPIIVHQEGGQVLWLGFSYCEQNRGLCWDAATTGAGRLCIPWHATHAPLTFLCRAEARVGPYGTEQ